MSHGTEFDQKTGLVANVYILKMIHKQPFVISNGADFNFPMLSNPIYNKPRNGMLYQVVPFIQDYTLHLLLSLFFHSAGICHRNFKVDGNDERHGW